MLSASKEDASWAPQSSASVSERREKKPYPAPASPPCMKYAAGCKLGTGLKFDSSIFVCQVAEKEALAGAKKGRVGLDALSITGLQ